MAEQAYVNAGIFGTGLIAIVMRMDLLITDNAFNQSRGD